MRSAGSAASRRAPPWTNRCQVWSARSSEQRRLKPYAACRPICRDRMKLTSTRKRSGASEIRCFAMSSSTESCVSCRERARTFLPGRFDNRNVCSGAEASTARQWRWSTDRSGSQTSIAYPRESIHSRASSDRAYGRNPDRVPFHCRDRREY